MMTPLWDKYVSAGAQGHSRWFHWIGGFWFIILGWVLGQLLIGPLLSISLNSAAPELSTQIQDATIAAMSDPDIFDQLTKLTVIFFLGMLISIATWLLARLSETENVIKITSLIALLATISAAYAGFEMLPLMNDPVAAKLTTKAMGASPFVYASMLLSFPLTLLFTFLVTKLWHSRSIRSLITGLPKVNWGRMFEAGFIFLAIAAVFTAISHVTGLSEVKAQFDPKRFFGFALVSLLIIPFQAATEEVIVRGYMNQGLAQFIKNPWIIFIITSLFFMALHLGNPEATSSADAGATMHLITMSSYFLFGLLLCILVYYEGGLESAIGIHAANNLFASIFVNYEGSVLPVPSAFITQQNPPVDLPVFVLMLGLVVFLLLKYRPMKRLS